MPCQSFQRFDYLKELTKDEADQDSIARLMQSDNDPCQPQNLVFSFKMVRESKTETLKKHIADG